MSKRPGQWGHRWEAGPQGGPVAVSRSDCGEPVHVQRRCRSARCAHRLFIANDRELSGNVRLSSESSTTKSCCRTRKDGLGPTYRDLRVGNPLVAGSSPAHPTSVTRENLPRLASSFLLRRGMAGGGDLPERMTGRSSRDVTAHGASPVHGLHDIDPSRAGLGFRKNDTHLRRMPDDID